MCHCVVCREMKKQQWLFKVFSMKNSSSSTTSFNNVRLRQFCSATTTTTSTNLFDPPTVAPPVNSGTFQLKKLKILLEKKLPLLIVPFDYVTKQKYVELPHKSLDDGGFICDGTVGFISLFDHDDNQLIINNNNNNNKKKKQLEEVLVYMMHLSKIAKRRICGSSEGWLVTIHRNGQIQLLNPVTKVRVHLPPLTAIPGVSAQFVSDCEDTKGRLCYLDLTDFNIDEPPYYLISGSHEFREGFIYKAVTNTTTTTTTTTTSTNPAPTVVVIIYSNCDHLAFCRTSLSTGNEIDDGADEPAAKRWIEIPTGNDCIIKCWNDVTFHKGNFYVVGNFGNVGVVKGLDGPSPFMQCVIDGPEVDDDPDFVVNYLVESPSSSSSGGGDLLMVMRTANYVEETKEKEEEKEENFEHPYRTIGFKVWKLDLNGPSWEEVKDLGEDGALFIGYNQSFSTSASKFPGCRGNCIYFTDNSQMTQMNVIYPTGGHDIGVYNLVDGSFEKLYETSSSRQLFMPPPVWYVPN